MKIAAMMIDKIADSALTEDGHHMALTLREASGNLMTLGLPSRAVCDLVDRAAYLLAERQRVLRFSGEANETFAATWWNLVRASPKGDFVLSLTFGSGGSLDFSLTPHMAASLIDTLSGHLKSGSQTQDEDRSAQREVGPFRRAKELHRG